MSTVPVPAGLTALICVSETMVKLAAAVSPKRTAVAPVKNRPVIVTVVPPGDGPFVGAIDVTIAVSTGLVSTIVMSAVARAMVALTGVLSPSVNVLLAASMAQSKRSTRTTLGGSR